MKDYKEMKEIEVPRATAKRLGRNDSSLRRRRNFEETGPKSD